mmetsp:Transcript_2272/g.4137  ORF Transcript_2272/g.4137 Transcript_2272/m.4137 type:complete len:286 (+) Transcript_2272:28-885(+)
MGNLCCLERFQSKKEHIGIFLGEVLLPDVPSDSDHNALLWTMQRVRRETLRIVSWNILCQFGCNEQFGFCYCGYNRKFEAESDYLKRLERIARKVQLFAANHQPQAVLLQECAEPGKFGHGVMFQLLSQHLAPLGFQLFQEAEFVTAVRGSGQVVKLPPLQRQSEKFHAVKSEELACFIVNTHLRFDLRNSQSSAETREDLMTVLLHLQKERPNFEIFFAGDTNRVPEANASVHAEAEIIEQLASDLGVLAHPPGPTNVRYLKEKSKSEMTYADYALSCPPATIS